MDKMHSSEFFVPRTSSLLGNNESSICAEANLYDNVDEVTFVDSSEHTLLS